MSSIDKKNEIQNKPSDNIKNSNHTNLMVNTKQDLLFNDDDLGHDMPHVFVNETGDSNQNGRSAEEEIENNTDIDKNQENKIESENLDALSDRVNEKIDNSIRITGKYEDE
jgi:hypothetical protein